MSNEPPPREPVPNDFFFDEKSGIRRDVRETAMLLCICSGGRKFSVRQAEPAHQGQGL